VADPYMRIGHWRIWFCLNAVRNVDEKKESGNRQRHGPGPMSKKVLKLPEHETAFASGQLYGPSVLGHGAVFTDSTHPKSPSRTVA
jgi:hypothetical protein